MEIKFNLSNTEHKELVSYCNLNDLLVSEVVKKSFTTGFSIERYGLLSEGAKVVEKEVEKIVEKIVEIPVEVIKEVVKIEYVEVPVEVIKEGEVVEIIKEVPVEVVKEVIIEKEPDTTKQKALEQTLHKLKTENIEKDKKIRELEQTINNIQFSQINSATYLRGSNLNDKLF
jgi:predicted Rossmann fold nucleotide-binding protein DprA/Smf involved in DNA uptake